MTNENEVILMRDIYEAMAMLLRSELMGEKLNEEEKQKITEGMMPQICSMAKKHDVANIIGQAVSNNNISVPKSVASFLKSRQAISVLRYEQMKRETISVCDILEQGKFTHMPLKGAVIRKYYKEPSLRTSCDVDILIPKDEIDAAVEYLCTNYNYRIASRSDHDICVIGEMGVHVELHYKLMKSSPEIEKALAGVWDNIKKVEGTEYRYEMSNENFYAYLIVHMSKHFLLCGTGIRGFMDVWVFRHNVEIDKDKVEKILKQCGVAEFEKEVVKLSEIWFSGKQHDDFSLQVEEYIMSSGAFGTLKNQISMFRVNKGGKVKYILRRIFLDPEVLKTGYPILDKYPVLLPFCEVHRWIVCLMKGKLKVAKNELSVNSKINKEDQEKYEEMCRRLNITKKA